MPHASSSFRSFTRTATVALALTAHCGGVHDTHPVSVSAAHANATSPDAATPSRVGAFGAIAGRICPPLVEARCAALASCGCSSPASDCVARETARCEGWVGSVYLIVGYEPQHTIEEQAARDCIVETRAQLSGPFACSGGNPAAACLRLHDETYVSRRSTAPIVATHLAESGAPCDVSFVCGVGLACVRGHCAPVDHCGGADADCGHGMRCAAQSGVCEPRSCDPWQFWNPDVVDT